MVGTHFPEERDILESALQRMREAFEGLRDGGLAPGPAQDLFNDGYDEVRDVTSMLLLSRRAAPASRPGEAAG
jgi:hypothetical protein